MINILKNSLCIVGAVISKWFPSFWRKFQCSKHQPMEKAKSPFLEGNFAPWRSEDDFENLEIIGKLPDDLNGVLLRNGPNPQFDPVGRYHWFEGDGMLHAIYLAQGKARYRNRWVRTERFKREQAANQPLFSASFSGNPDPSLENVSVNTANTNIIAFNNYVLALNEGAVPMLIEQGSLKTLGDYTFYGQIQTAFTAHPRYDHKTKELLAFSYINNDGSLHYYRINSDAKVIANNKIDWPYSSMMHDFINTKHYVIFPVFPATMSFDRMMQGGGLFLWEGDVLETYFIVTDRNGRELARFMTDPCYVYHFGNAYESGDSIIIDAIRGKVCALMPGRNGKVADREETQAHLVRWTLNMKTQKIHAESLDNLTGEFPRFDERFNGYQYNHLYMGANPKIENLFDRIVHYDLSSGNRSEHCFEDAVPGEPVFVPRSEKEGDGYLLTVVYRKNEDRSDVVILDARQVSSEPIAIIKIPHRIPFGFHGNFVMNT